MEAAYKKCLSNVLDDYKIDNVLILSPTKKGLLGTQLINKNVQQIANPQSSDKREIKYGDTVYREKDRVINIRNNYNAVNDEEEKTVVYNGDIGEVKKVDGDKKHVVVDYTFDSIRTEFNMLDTLVHSYALTIHKSQGSGFPVVILIMDKAHKWQLNANLLYTGITRAKEKLYIICQADVINAAMKKNENQKRNTFLYEMLIGSAS
jgi:ATP-dependent exoDNAse (exonuclease V) alpha subunit